MFTGIIEEVGTVLQVEPRAVGARLRLACRKVLQGSAAGASMAVNGVCLTIAARQDDSFAADISPETLRRSNLGDLREGAQVNLERPLMAGGRLDGHIVQGHVDATGELLSLDELGDGNWWLRIRVPPEVERYVVFKGSLGLDGISLTVAALEGNVVSVTIIPHTYRQTNLRARRPGDRINLECDVIAKYVEKMMRRGGHPAGLTEERMRELGY